MEKQPNETLTQHLLIFFSFHFISGQYVLEDIELKPNWREEIEYALSKKTNIVEMSVPFWFDYMASDMRLDICLDRNVPFDLFQTRFVLHKTLFSAKVIFYFFRIFFTTTLFSVLWRCIL